MKRKNFLWSMMALTVAAVLSVGFTACGGDDDEGGSGGGSGSPKTNIGVLDAKSGLRLKSVGDYTYYYNNKGLIDYIADKYDRYEFSYNPNKIYVVDNYDKDDESLSVSYNKSGYLSALSYSFERDKTEGLWSESAKANYSYDGSGHLTKIAGSGKEIGTDDGERITYTWTFSYVLTWRNDKLMQVAWTETEIEDGESDTETETYTFQYENNDYQNAYCQWAPSIARALDDFEDCLAFVGLLGVGPTMLPSSGERYEEYYSDGKKKTETKEYNFNHRFNSDGSLNSVTVNSNTYKYTYDYVGDEDYSKSRSIAVDQDEQQEQFVKSMRQMLHRKGRHASR